MRITCTYFPERGYFNIMDFGQFQGRIERDYPLKKLNTWKIGGQAEYVFWPTQMDELVQMVAWCKENDVRVCIFGRGSNVLFPDSGVRGMVIITTNLNRSTWENHTVKVEAGYSLMRLASEAAAKGLKGMEFACSIPGTVGAAIMNNAGAYGGNIATLVKEVKVLTENGNIVVLQKGDIDFGYRNTSLQESQVMILECTLQFEPGGDSTALKEIMNGYMDKRRKAQPLEYPNAGSIFRNPPGDSAGRLIEQAGWKGRRIGNAQVSEKHANFIVNRGDAKSDHVIDLITGIQKDVKEKFGIQLETEVRIITG